MVILYWWLDSAHKIISGVETEVDMHFMDGSMLVRATLIADGMLRLECIAQKSSHEIVVLSVDVRLAEFIAELIMASKKVVLACDFNGWENDDIRLLKNAIERYRDSD